MPHADGRPYTHEWRRRVGCRPIGSKPVNHDEDLQILEKHIDMCIKHADDIGRWPAKVDELRRAFADVTLNEIVEKYRSVGWHVVIMAEGSSAMMLIDRQWPAT